MENLGFRKSHGFSSLFLILILLLLLVCFVLSSSEYSLPDKYFVNCGSDSNVSYGEGNFVGDRDLISDGDPVSFPQQGGRKGSQSSSATSSIYQTARIFKRRSSYEFKLDSVGFYVVRLHFWAVPSQTDLLTARFSVYAPGFTLLKSFSFGNSSNHSREEFLLTIDSVNFKIFFEPEGSSLAFVNAIEVFLAPENLIPDEVSMPITFRGLNSRILRPIQRLNVGGQKLTPDIDTLLRNWSPDDGFLLNPITATNVYPPYTQTPHYDGGVTQFIAPDPVYQTAKRMNQKSSEPNVLNVTWTFRVRTNLKYFIRAHFCDIVHASIIPDFAFNLFINGSYLLEINPTQDAGAVGTPFYHDFVVDSDNSGFLNVSIGNKEPKGTAFLNGLEVMEITDKSDSCLASCTGSSSRKLVYIITGSVAGGLVLILALVILFFLKRKKSRKPVDEVSEWSRLPGGSDTRNLNLGLKIPFSVILIATDNFDDKLLVGKGGFGDVYEGIIPSDRTKVAVKRCKRSSGQGWLEFQTEIQVLSRIRHRHLVSLIGYCDENSEMILVYEFMEKGTLKEHLYGSNSNPLSWKQRLEICIGAARGLHYLHSGSAGGIIHRDVKSTNILLDGNLVAKVADFGLSKHVVADQNQTHLSSKIKGTFGYLDPEYFQTQILTDKSDVYSFGVVLLEVLCARPAIDNSLPTEQVNLAEWGMFCKSKGIIEEIVDPSLTGQIYPNSLRKFLEVTEKCLKEESGERPSMADVVWDLEYALQLQRTAIRREPHEDSGATGGGVSSVLELPSIGDSGSFSTKLQTKELKVAVEEGSSLSETQVFSQIKSSEAR